MPVIKSAIKKLRKDRRLEAHNDDFRKKMRDTLRHAEKEGANLKNLQEAYSIIDKAAKKNLIHANKAAHLKADIAKMIRPVKSTKSKSASPSA